MRVRRAREGEQRARALRPLLFVRPPTQPSTPVAMSFASPRTLRPLARTLAQAGPAPVQVRNMATLREIEMRCASLSFSRLGLYPRPSSLSPPSSRLMDVRFPSLSSQAQVGPQHREDHQRESNARPKAIGLGPEAPSSRRAPLLLVARRRRRRGGRTAGVEQDARPFAPAMELREGALPAVLSCPSFVERARRPLAFERADLGSSADLRRGVTRSGRVGGEEHQGRRGCSVTSPHRETTTPSLCPFIQDG